MANNIIPISELKFSDIFGEAVARQFDFKLAEIASNIADGRGYRKATRSIHISVDIHPHDDGLVSVYVKLGTKLPPIQVLALTASIDKPKDPTQPDLYNNISNKQDACSTKVG